MFVYVPAFEIDACDPELVLLPHVWLFYQHDAEFFEFAWQPFG